MADFDILDDVNQKFTSTIVMYDKKAMFVKAVQTDPDALGQFILCAAAPNARALKDIKLLDPALNYKNYNIGYVNGGKYASWWYRKPHKQWSQGLRSNQMGWRVASPGGQAHDNFGFSRPFINMLENIYPDIESVKKALINQEEKALAFHRDFALSFDEIHDDFILEYHGAKIGASMDKELKQFKIKPEARYLIEALQEARRVHA